MFSSLYASKDPIPNPFREEQRVATGVMLFGLKCGSNT